MTLVDILFANSLFYAIFEINDLFNLIPPAAIRIMIKSDISNRSSGKTQLNPHF